MNQVQQSIFQKTARTDRPLRVGMLARALTALVLFSPNLVFAALGDLDLTVPVLDSQVTLQTRAEFGGAVTSLVFRGKEHIDSRDHGRLLQSASSFEGYGECFNPTEGGSSQLSPIQNTSVVKSARTAGNQLWTTTDMGFWRNPGEAYPKGCGTKKYLTRTVNTTLTSGHLIEKRLTVGLPNFPNVIEHLVTFQAPTQFLSGTFEASTGYVPKEFSRAEYFDPSNGAEIDPGNRQGEQALPVILFTSDRSHAIGVYSPQLPQGGRAVGYGRFAFPNVNKWNCVFRENDIKPGAYEYQCLIVLGTLAEVENTMRRLAKSYPHSNTPIPIK